MPYFTLLPVLDTLIGFYKKPPSPARFQDYLNLMTPNRKDVILPIMGYNPMAKGHVLTQLEALKALNTEGSLEAIISKVNEKTGINEPKFQVALVLADDLKGGWTNRILTDYNSKFVDNFNQVKRPFCTPYFWSSEDFSIEKIENRVEEYLWRTVFQVERGFNKTLLHHLQQEAFVKKRMGVEELIYEEGDLVHALFDQHKMTTSEPFILAFLYGDEAVEHLGHRSIGAFADMGFLMARQVTNKLK
jgi:hypothetical protein